jgi:hypothetical protein
MTAPIIVTRYSDCGLGMAQRFVDLASSLSAH